MKKCSVCDAENTDDADECHICGFKRFVLSEDELRANQELAREQAISKYESICEELEKSREPVFFSFLVTSMFKQEIGEVPVLSYFIRRGWEFTAMDVINADVEISLKETHFLVKWPGR